MFYYTRNVKKLVHNPPVVEITIETIRLAAAGYQLLHNTCTKAVNIINSRVLLGSRGSLYSGL